MMSLLLKRTAAALGMFAALSGAAYAVDPGFPAPVGDASLVPAGARLDRIFDGAFRFSPKASLPATTASYTQRHHVHRRLRRPVGQVRHAGTHLEAQPQDRQDDHLPQPVGMSNGIKFDRGEHDRGEGADFGAAIPDAPTCAGKLHPHRAVRRPTVDRPNDVTIDESGRMYFTDPRYLGHEPIDQGGFAVYRIDPRHGDAVASGSRGSRRCPRSPDQKTMYVVSNDNGSGCAFENLKKGETTVQAGHLLQAYDIDASGNLSNRRVLIDYGKLDKPCSGPDGMVADEKGNIWLAARCEYRPGIQVLSPDRTGNCRYISTGKELPTNVGFGRGEDSNLL